MIGDIGSPDESIGFSFTHNFSPDFKLKFGGLYVDGFYGISRIMILEYLMRNLELFIAGLHAE